jgi:hypothetical protein
VTESGNGRGIFKFSMADAAHEPEGENEVPCVDGHLRNTNRRNELLALDLLSSETVHRNPIAGSGLTYAYDRAWLMA